MKSHQDAERLATKLGTIMRGLSEDGVLVLETEVSPTILHPKGDVGFFAGMEMIINTLESLEEVESIFVFDEDFLQADFSEKITPTSFLVACKNASFYHQFYSVTPETVDEMISARTVETKSGKPVLQYYDGAVHASLQVPPKAYETTYCRREPMPF